MFQREWIRGRFNLGVMISACLVMVGFSAIHGLPWSDSAAAETGLKIARITPSGVDIPPGRQIVFEFNRPVVPLGRMERNASEIPVSIEPALSCQWRWLNSSNLACQLDEQHAMAPSTRYDITVGAGISTEDGAVLAEPVTHFFITQRPKIGFAVFDKWLSPVKPQLRVRFEQVVRQDSIEAHVFFKGEAGLRVAAKVLEDDRYSKFEKPGINWVLSPAGDLPADKAAELVVEPGILSQRGTEPGIESRTVFSFRTLGQFRFEGVQCLDMNGAKSIIRPQAGGRHQTRCNPLSPVSLLFTSPVAQSEIKANVSITRRARAPGPKTYGPNTKVTPWSGNCLKKMVISPTSSKTNPSNLSVNTGSEPKPKASKTNLEGRLPKPLTCLWRLTICRLNCTSTRICLSWRRDSTPNYPSLQAISTG